MSYTRYEWIKDLNHALGNTQPTHEVEEFLLGWTFVESSPPGAMYNLLNTTERASGSTNFNSVGVQNFTSYQQGIDVTATLLKHSIFYTHLYAALKNNDIKALGYGATMSPEVSHDLQIWVSGKPDGDPQYPIDVRNASNKGYSDLFPGNKYTDAQLRAMAKTQSNDILAALNNLNNIIVQL